MKLREFFEFMIVDKIEGIFRRIHHFFCKIQRVLRYLPAIWADEDWDFTYFLKVIQVKLRQMEEYEAKYSIAMGNEVNIENIHKVSDTINRYTNFDEAWDVENNFTSIEDKLGIKRDVSTDSTTGYIISKYVYKDTGKEITQEDEEKISKFYKKYANEEEKAWKRIWTLISKHSRQWGD